MTNQALTLARKVTNMVWRALRGKNRVLKIPPEFLRVIMTFQKTQGKLSNTPFFPLLALSYLIKGLKEIKNKF